MLTLLRADVAAALALAWLVIGMTLPILAVWFGVRVARDLRRIAEAADLAVRYNRELFIQRPAQPRVTETPASRRVSNSMFGR